MPKDRLARPSERAGQIFAKIGVDFVDLLPIADAAGPSERSASIAQAARTTLRSGEVAVKKAVKRKVVMKQDKKGRDDRGAPRESRPTHPHQAPPRLTANV